MGTFLGIVDWSVKKGDRWFGAVMSGVSQHGA